MIEYQAAAKINLALHVTGRQDNGYHTLDTLVTFAEYGDVIRVEPADDLSLSISGPFSATLGAGTHENHADNLVLIAARRLQQAALEIGRPRLGAAIHLKKRLPVASGIGGGSADAAATLQALGELWALDMAAIDQDSIALRLGADVPMCLRARPLRAKGIGEEIEDVFLPKLNLVLVNPGVAVSTPEIFRSLAGTFSPPLPPLGQEISNNELLGWLRNTNNDLQQPAVIHTPQIETVLGGLLESRSCSLARMSGSGATCFGIFPTAKCAKIAANDISQRFPAWWCVASSTIATNQKDLTNARN